MVEVVNPLTNPAWDRWVSGHPGAGVFHSSAWARVLVESYRFTPHYLVETREGQPVAGWPMMQVGGKVRARRGVSLPFTDSCPPLMESDGSSATASKETVTQAGSVAANVVRPAVPATATVAQRDGDLDAKSAAQPLLAAALAHGRQHRWRSIELREATVWSGIEPASVSFFGHAIDLRQGASEALERCESPVKRAIRKSQASGLRLVEGRDEAAIRAYYRLHCLTRRRHGLPPQPIDFFVRIQRHLLANDHGTVLLVLKDQTPVAGAVFLQWNGQALYKFGASDEAHQALRPNNLLFAEAIRICAARGCAWLDLGRTSRDNEGLRRFKLGWGSVERIVPYLRYDLSSRRVIDTPDRADGWHTRVFRRLPRPMASLVGRFVYPFAA